MEMTYDVWDTVNGELLAHGSRGEAIAAIEQFRRELGDIGWLHVIVARDGEIVLELEGDELIDWVEGGEEEKPW